MLKSTDRRETAKSEERDTHGNLWKRWRDREQHGEGVRLASEGSVETINFKPAKERL